MDYKWYAALAYVRANRLNHNVIEGPNDRFGIIASGKAYNDTRQALARPRPRRRDLPPHRPAPAQGQRRLAARGDDHARLRRGPARRSSSSRRSARSSSTSSRKSSTAGAPTCGRTCSASSTRSRATTPAANGARPTRAQHWLLRAQADLTPAIIAKAIAKRLAKLGVDADVSAGMALRVALIDAKEQSLGASTAGPRRPAPARPASARPGSAAAARTTPRPRCPRARAPSPASAATTWRSGWTARPSASARWAARACRGSARRRSRPTPTSSPTSATAPTSTRACWRCASRSPPASTSPTRSSSTTPSR